MPKHEIGFGIGFFNSLGNERAFQNLVNTADRQWLSFQILQHFDPQCLFEFEARLVSYCLAPQNLVTGCILTSKKKMNVFTLRSWKMRRALDVSLVEPALQRMHCMFSYSL